MSMTATRVDRSFPEIRAGRIVVLCPYCRLSGSRVESDHRNEPTDVDTISCSTVTRSRVSAPAS
jgi:hypothetical protein